MAGRPHRMRALPADFAERAPGMSISRISETWRCRSEVAQRWCREAGIEPSGVRCDAAPVPPDFAELAKVKSRDALKRHYRSSWEAVNRWFAQTGLVPVARSVREPRPGGLFSHRTSSNGRAFAGYRKAPVIQKRAMMAANHVTRDDSLEGRAADHLRRDAAVYRCGENGRADPKGSFWRYGNVVLSGTELVERAKRKGWEPDAWMGIAA